MKLFEKFNMSEPSKTYIILAFFGSVLLFLIMSITFLWLFFAKSDIVMSQPAGETYVYFMTIADRMLLFFCLFLITPITVYQITYSNKSKADTFISAIAIIVLLIIIGAFTSGEIRYYNKYKDGKLSYSPMFCTQTIETQIFDYILTKNKEEKPQMCLTPSMRPKGLNKD